MESEQIVDLLGRASDKAADALVERVIDAIADGSRESYAEAAETLTQACRLVRAAAPEETAQALCGDRDDPNIAAAFVLGQLSAAQKIAATASLSVTGRLFHSQMRRHAGIVDAIADHALDMDAIAAATGASPDEVVQSLAQMQRCGISDVRADRHGWRHFLTPEALAWLGANDLAGVAPSGEKAARRRREIKAFFRDSVEVRNFLDAHCSSRAPWRVLVDRESRLVVSGPDGNPTYGVVATSDGFTVFGHHDPLILVAPDPEVTGCVVAANVETVAEAFAAAHGDARLVMSPRS